MGTKSSDTKIKKKHELTQDEVERLRTKLDTLEAENLRLKGEIEENRRSTERYRLICRDTDDLIAVTTFGLNPIYTYISPSHEKLMGYKPLELVGQPGLKYIHPRDRLFMIPLLKGYFKNKLRGLMKKASVHLHEHLEYRALAKDGSWHYLQSTVNVINDELLFISRDMTAQRKVEEEKRDLEDRLRQSEKMEAIGTLAAGVAHDLNNILSGIINYPELLLLELPQDHRFREPLHAIMDAGTRAAAIVNDLLALVRRKTMTMEPVPINKVITDYLASPEYKQLLSFYPQICVIQRLGDHTGNILGSPVHLGKMLMNLVTNAAEASPDGGTITITSSSQLLEKPVKGYDRDVPPGEYVVLAITDEGVGMEPDHMKRIFMPFYSKKKMGRSGTGLGMTVVWGTVADHNGFIVLRSEPGKGTAIQLFFPVTQKPVSASRMKPEPFIEEYMGNSETIMVIDDLPEQQEIASLLLTQLNYNVSAAGNLEEALDMIEGVCPDLFILDMILDNNPDGLDGLDNYRRIIKQYPEAKAIITSGYSETGRVRKALELGVGAYIQKPYDLPMIATAIKKELER